MQFYQVEFYQFYPVCHFFGSIFFFWLSYFVVSCFIVNIYWLSNSEKSRILFFNSKFFCKETGKQPKVYAFVSWIALNKLFFDWTIISVYIFWQVNINSCIILCILCRWNLSFLGVNIFNIFPAKSSGFLIALLYCPAGNSCYE